MATKPASPKSATKPAKAAKAAKPDLKVVSEGGEEGEAKSSGLKLKELVDRVVAASGVKKKDAKTVVEATLAEIGKAMAAGESLSVPGLGKLRVAKAGAEGGGAMTLKLRQPTPGAGKAKTDKDTLAEADE